MISNYFAAEGRYDRKGHASYDRISFTASIWRGMQAEAVRRAFEKLDFREQMLLEKRNAVCMTCGHVGPLHERTAFEDMAVMFEGSTASGAEWAYRRAVEHLTMLLFEDGAIRAMRLRQKSKTVHKKKITAVVYEYQADCDGEWGKICFDFETGTAEIVRLADWDTMGSKVFAKRAIRFLPELHRLAVAAEEHHRSVLSQPGHREAAGAGEGVPAAGGSSKKSRQPQPGIYLFRRVPFYHFIPPQAGIRRSSLRRGLHPGPSRPRCSVSAPSRSRR